MEEAYEELYKENAALVYHFLLSKCRNPDVAEDLTQETFLQALKSIDRYNGNCKISVWLCQIAKHLLYQYWEKRKENVPLEDDWMISEEPGVERQVLAREELLDVLGRLHQLPVNMREVVYLRVSGDLSFREIGRIMGKSENWARVNFFRAKELLKGG
ncbi:MAG: sigma-70 family RNA polymerase sigma factor [Acetatifactor sp.]|nr:sigma-70 family RNA polymerase sigma factor [Acetatifactor sp.]